MSDSSPDQSYYQRRASEERSAAEQSRDERVRDSHLELARRYDEAAAGRIPAASSDERPSALPMPEFRIIN